MYQISSMNSLRDVPAWAKVEPTTFHLMIAALVREQTWPDSQYTPAWAVASVDLSMAANRRFFDSDLCQIARILAQTLQPPRRTFDQWYEIIKSAWGWRLLEVPTCPSGFAPDALTKECAPVPAYPPFLPNDVGPPPPVPTSRVPLFLIGGLGVGLLLFSQR